MGNFKLFYQENASDILKEILEYRRERNPSYSLRAMARSLELSPSRLSTLINHQGKISDRTARKISQRLEMSPLEQEYFLALAASGSAKSAELRWQALNKARNIRLETIYRRIDAKALQKIHWQHFALRFLLTAQGQQKPLAAAAKQLGLTVRNAELIVEDLCAAGLLLNRDGEYSTPDERLSIEHAPGPTAIRQFHRSLMGKALESLENNPVDERYFRSCIFTLSKEQYQELTERILEFVTTCTDQQEASEKPHQEVYALGVQLFPLMDKKLGREYNDLASQSTIIGDYRPRSL